MKKIETLGKVLSRNELKQINGAAGAMFNCVCFSGEAGSGQTTGMFQTSDPINAMNSCPSGSTRVSCYNISQE